jgi:hypothetical protein
MEIRYLKDFKYHDSFLVEVARVVFFFWSLKSNVRYLLSIIIVNSDHYDNQCDAYHHSLCRVQLK